MTPKYLALPLIYFLTAATTPVYAADPSPYGMETAANASNTIEGTAAGGEKETTIIDVNGNLKIVDKPPIVMPPITSQEVPGAVTHGPDSTNVLPRDADAPAPAPAPMVPSDRVPDAMPAPNTVPITMPPPETSPVGTISMPPADASMSGPTSLPPAEPLSTMPDSAVPAPIPNNPAGR